MADYYKLDSRKITLGEYWNITRSWKALIPWIAARLGAPLNFGTEFRQPETVKELEVPEAEFSPQARAKLQPLLDQCLQLGFHSPRFYCLESTRQCLIDAGLDPRFIQAGIVEHPTLPSFTSQP